MDTLSGGVIDRVLMEGMEIVVGDHNPRCSKQKKGTGQDRGAVWVNAAQAILGNSTIRSTLDENDVKSLGLSPDQLQTLMKLLKYQNNNQTEKMTRIPRITTLKVDKGVSLDLWHQPLRHSSMQATKIVSGINLKKGIENLNNCCDVCQREKQTKNKFLVSDFRASDVFELIHCDLWGPYKNVSSCGTSYFLTIVNDYSRTV